MTWLPSRTFEKLCKVLVTARGATLESVHVRCLSRYHGVDTLIRELDACELATKPNSAATNETDAILPGFSLGYTFRPPAMTSLHRQ